MDTDFYTCGCQVTSSPTKPYIDKELFNQQKIESALYSKKWTLDDQIMHDFISWNPEGVSLSQICEHINRFRTIAEGKLTITQTRSKLLTLSAKDYKLYEDSIKFESKDKSGKITIKKEIRYFIDLD